MSSPFHSILMHCMKVASLSYQLFAEVYLPLKTQHRKHEHRGSRTWIFFEVIKCKVFHFRPAIIIPFQFYNLGNVQDFVFLCVCVCGFEFVCVCVCGFHFFLCVSVCLCFCIVLRGVLHIVWALLFIVVFDMGNSGAGAANLTTWTLQCLSGEFFPWYPWRVT